MKVAMIGPMDISNYDRKEIEKYLDLLLMDGGMEEESEILLLAYRSIELAVLSYFLERPQLAPKLHVYTFQTLQNLPEEIKGSIQFLSSLGTKHTSFNINTSIVHGRETYLTAWNAILQNADMLVSFYNSNPEETTKILAPLELAKQQNIRADKYTLPGKSSDLYKMSVRDRIKQVN